MLRATNPVIESRASDPKADRVTHHALHPRPGPVSEIEPTGASAGAARTVCMDTAAQLMAKSTNPNDQPQPCWQDWQADQACSQQADMDQGLPPRGHETD